MGPHGYKYSENSIAYMADTASVLTPKQRDYLNAPIEDNPDAAERAMRSRIRERIEASFQDYLLLTATYPDDELEKIFSDELPPQEAVIAFLYAAQPENGMIAEDAIEGESSEGVDRQGRWLESKVSRGIERSIALREGVDADVECSIAIERTEDLEELAKGDLSELPRDKLDRLLVTKTISREEYGKANEQRLERIFED